MTVHIGEMKNDVTVHDGEMRLNEKQMEQLVAEVLRRLEDRQSGGPHGADAASIRNSAIPGALNEQW